jgi:type IV pilus assembly protein PilA
MFCARCGKEVISSAAFCSACGAPTGAGIDPDKAVRRPGLVTLLAVLQFIAAALWLVGGALMIIAVTVDDDSERVVMVVVGAIFLLFGTLSLVCGIGLWKLKPYGRILQIGFAGLGLLGIPIGTIISILILVYMFKPGIRVLFSGKPASTLTPGELGELATLSQDSAATTILIVALTILGSVAAVGIIAAIAVPGLLRARMAGNEAVAIGSMRSIVSAQTVYAGAAGGGAYAVKLATLGVACPGTSQAFITPELAQDPSIKNGYRVALESAGAAPGPNDCNGVPTELDYYATAVPLTHGTTGRRAFSTSNVGTIFVDDSGVAPSVAATLSGTGTPLR